MEAMQEISNNSENIKLALMQYFRYKRNYISATEVNITYGIADVMVWDNKKDRYYEVEVKISKPDLLRDIKNKYKKHLIYKNADRNHGIPNKLYYCVPSELEKTALDFIEKNNSNYGLIGVHIPQRKWGDYIPMLGNFVRIVKRASLLNDIASRNIRHAMIKRLCTENIGLRERIFREMYFNNNRTTE